MNERLYRSRDDRMIAGVAGGLAELWDADPSLIRIVWALLVFLTGGLALLVYIIMAIVVPEEDDVWSSASAAVPPSAPTGTPAAPSAAPADVDLAAATTQSVDVPPVGGAAADAPPAGFASVPPMPPVAPPPQPGALWAAPPVDARHAARMQAKAERRAARAERRANGPVTGAMIVGLVLVALGAYFLVREWLPQFDFEWFWPMMLILLGVVLLVVALGRKPGDPGAPPR